MMSRWFRIDCDAMSHDKVVELDDAEFRFWIECIAHSASQGTDGNIKSAWIMRIARRPLAMAERLVEVGLFDRDGDDYCLHDYHQKQPASSYWENKSRAGSKGAKIRWEREKAKNSVDGTDGKTYGKPMADAMAHANGTNTNTNTSTKEKEKIIKKEKESSGGKSTLALAEEMAKANHASFQIRLAAMDAYKDKNGVVPSALVGTRGDKWEEVIQKIITEDGVPADKVELVARHIWTSGWHSSQFLNVQQMRDKFDDCLNVVNNYKSNNRRFVTENAGDEKAKALKAIAAAMEEEENEGF